MIALDTNILVYAHRADSPFHAAAANCIRDLCATPARWAVPWPCVQEFISVVTHPRIYRQPTPLTTALTTVQALLSQPNVVTLAESEGYFEVLAELTLNASLQGPAIHDARIATLCLHHGVRELWSADRDFSRFGKLRTVNPLVG